MTVNVKDHGEGVVSVCDTSLLGKTLEEGELCLKVSEAFYKGEEMAAQQSERYMLLARHLNLLGEESVSTAMRLSLVNEDNTIKIAGVPHALVYTVE